MRYLLTLPTIFLILNCSGLVSAAPKEDLVHPFDEVPYGGHNWYSGYLEFTGAKFHYVFFDSQRDPDNDPLILWLNGGPGCSSMIGMVYENGPFVFEHNTTELKFNEYSWNKKANLLYIESPGGVGYSISDKEFHSDATVAEDNLMAMLKFY